MEWTHENHLLQPTDWGWRLDNSRLVPFATEYPPAPANLLNIIRCKCKTNCDSRRCSCRKHGLDCSVACTECRGQSCSNSQMVIPEDDRSQ